MDNQEELESTVSKSSKFKKMAFAGCGAIILCLLCVFGVGAFALWGGGGEPATLAVPQRVDRDFLQAIHDGEIDTAYDMLSEVLTTQMSRAQFVDLIQDDEKLFSAYQRFDVCDWGFFISGGRVITSSGLFYYEGGVIVVEISLHKDSDAVWRVQGFAFRPNANPQPFGLCK